MRLLKRLFGTKDSAGKAEQSSASPKLSLPPEFAEPGHAIDDISVQAELTPARRMAIAKQLTEYLIKSGAQIPVEKIPALQQKIQDCTFAGYRSDRMSEMLQADYGLSQGLASSLSAQSASIVLSKYRELRYRDIGCTRYKWSTSHDQRVCARCQALNGKVFSWDNPPEGGHPGECECWRLICPDYAKVPAGRLDSRCPNCEVELAKRPRGKTKCKSCQKEIWVRTNAEGQQVLLSQEMLANFDRQKYGPEICRCVAKPILEY
jgi:SPP1 gp7 family putative phage head morphogenesis protein